MTDAALSAPSRAHGHIGLAAALTAATAYGTNIVGARLAADAGMAAPLLVFYRVFILAVLVGLFALWQRRRLAIAKGEMPVLALLVITTSAMGIFYLTSVSFIPVTVAVVIFYTYPVMIVLASPFVTGEALRPQYLLIACVALAGITAVVGPSFESLDWRGLVLAFVAAMLTAAQFFAVNRASGTPTLAKIFYIQVGIIPVSFAVALFTGTLAGPDIAVRAPFAFALATIGYFIGFACQMLALSKMPANLAGLVFCLEPVVAALVSAWLLHERLSALQYAGGSLVIAAVVATVLMRDSRRAHPADE